MYLNKKTSGWFCNKPLTPAGKDCALESMVEADMHSQKNDGLQVDSDDSLVDPDFVLSDNDIISETSLSEDENCDNEIVHVGGDTGDERRFKEITLEPNFMQSTNGDELSTTETNIGVELDNQILSKNNHNQQNGGKFKKNGELRRGKKGMDFCFFCESSVLNFARHIQRNHALELEVQKICALPTGPERRKLLEMLRKKGNFLNSDQYCKAIRQPVVHKNLLPCSNCMGFYSSKLLWRHRKQCGQSGNRSHQADGQNFLLKHLKVDSQLRDQVFPRMRADRISLLAKKDSLICAFAARYIKIHREKHFATVTSRKMRELARLLIEVQKIDSSIKGLFDALKPKHFDLLLSATKAVAKFDPEKNSYESPTYALNMGTTLKQCCDIAIVFVLKRKEVCHTIPSAEAEADLRTVIHLIESQWRFEVSSQAANDLNINRWNKVTIIPLATDLKLFKEYLTAKAEEAVESLKHTSSRTKYLTLLETVYCRVILLNRRRPGELQRLSLDIYEKSNTNPQNYEEFSEVVTPSERILLQKFKRVVIRGKRGRGVPVLFSMDVQEHIGVLLQFREKFLPKNNRYLFGNPNKTEPICGYKVLKKYAHLCGAKNPQAITSTRLRKHLATLTQLFSMSEGDIEQLASFMGHTVGVHKGSYRLPDEIYQTAKISKLLLLMEKGGAAEFKGKPLNEINIDLEDDLMQETDRNCTNCDSDTEYIDDLAPSETDKNLENANTERNKKITKGKRQLIPWTEEQKDIVKQFFARHIENKKPPEKLECMELKEQHKELLNNKDWLKIKVFVQNEYTKKK